MPDKATGKSAGDAGGSGLDRVREELTKYLLTKANKVVSTAGDKMSKVAQGELPGELPKMGGKLLQGESPVKAVGGQVLKGVKDKAVEKTKELFGGGGKAGSKKVTNIIEVLDVGLPLRRVYDHWTEFEEFSSFMKGVVEASRSDDDDLESQWRLKVGPSKRSVKAEVLEQVPDERVVWKSSGETTTHGAVSFHELAPSLTRIVVVVEYTPGGFLEKTGSIWRVQGRRLRLDLKHFQRYVTLGAEEVPEGWRGEIREGELVRSHEDALADEESDEETDGNDEYDEYDEEGEYEEEGEEGEEDYNSEEER
ncbi:MAG: SRPBCC family protein [Streptomyces sp.]|uniref:SRPBCC family protein n=1 Tax=Streptomyces sp. TaxID=1931 RepID=UPI003D6B2FD1